jgi:AcrR family transcriptional regulator
LKLNTRLNCGKFLKKAQLIASDLDARERLLLAATQVCAERGIRSASVRRICDQAGVNMAMVNYYFGSKDELYLAVIKRAKEQGFVQPFLENSGNASGSATERLTAMIEYMLGSLLSDGPDSHAAKVISWELADPTPALAYIVDALIRPMNDVFMSLIHEISPSKLTEDQARLRTLSIVGQILLFGHSRPVTELLMPDLHYDEAGIRKLATHVANFSLHGLGATCARQCDEAALQKRSS